MSVWRKGSRIFLLGVVFFSCLALGCKSGETASTNGGSAANAGQPPFMSAVAGAPPKPAGEAPPAGKAGGFDGKGAYEPGAKQLSYGPRPAGSAGLGKVQAYLGSELKADGSAGGTGSFYGGRAA